MQCVYIPCFKMGRRVSLRTGLFLVLPTITFIQSRGKWVAEFRTRTEDAFENEIWRIGMITSADESDYNYISRKFVSSILQLPIQHNTSQLYINGWDDNETVDCVEIVWRFHSEPDELLGPTKFLVTADADPPYDALLGRKEWSRHRTGRGRGFRSRPFRHFKA
jgi:hypothetical protein